MLERENGYCRKCLERAAANVQAQGRCAALSRSVPWSAVLGIGAISNGNDQKEYEEKCDCR